MSANATSFASSDVDERIEHAQHERHDLRRRRSVGGRVESLADRQLDLRQPVADRKRCDQHAQLGQQRRNAAAARRGTRVMSATKLDLRSWKPTSTPPFFGTWRTDSRARWR